jgi:hypothetical protein
VLADRVAGEALKGGLEVMEVDVMDIFQAILHEGEIKTKKKTKKISTKKKKAAKTKPSPEPVAIPNVDLSDI